MRSHAACALRPRAVNCEKNGKLVRAHVDQVIQHSRAQLTICGHAANENRQQAPPPFVALAHARPEFQIAGAGGV